MEVKIKKLIEQAVTPKYAKKGDAALDFVATSMLILEEEGYGFVEYGTGISMEIPEGYVGLCFPRSSISNTGLILSNCVGVIDSGYRGEIKARFKWIKDTKLYDVGERVFQMIIMPYPQIELVEVDELQTTERGDGGFGSTGS